MLTGESRKVALNVAGTYSYLDLPKKSQRLEKGSRLMNNSNKHFLFKVS